MIIAAVIEKKGTVHFSLCAYVYLKILTRDFDTEAMKLGIIKEIELGGLARM